MVRIGIDGPDTSHVRVFTEAFATSGEARVVAMLSDGSIRNTQVLTDFSREQELNLHNEIHPFIEDVDAVLILGVDWGTHIDRALLFLSQGKRVFIDKPVAGSFTDLVRLRELQQHYPHQIMGGSALTCHPAFADLLKQMHEFDGPINIEIHGKMDSYFMASHSFELAGPLLSETHDAVVKWTDHIEISSLTQQMRIALKQSRQNVEHPWIIQARCGEELISCSFALDGIYDGLLEATSVHCLAGSTWSPGVSIELALAAERSGHSGKAVAIMDLDLGDVIPADAFVAEYRVRYGSEAL